MEDDGLLIGAAFPNSENIVHQAFCLFSGLKKEVTAWVRKAQGDSIK